MKKIAAIVLLILIIIAISGCSSSVEERETRTITATQNEITVSSESGSNESEKAVESKSESTSEQISEQTTEQALKQTKEQTPKQTPKQTQKQSSKQSKENGKRILIAYFTRADNVKQDKNLDAISSASINKNGTKIIGNMEIIADYIKNTTGGDKFSIQTEEFYSQDYETTTDQAMQEQNDDARPKLVTQVENMDDYDIIFIGYPNWWGTIPMPVVSFLESYDFSGKTIIPFCSHEGSGLGGGVSDIEAACPKSDVLEGFAVRGSMVRDSQTDISKWIDDLGIMQ